MSLRTVASALAGSLVLLTAPANATATVHLRGTAYEFNNADTRLGGAVIRIAEHPRLRATVRPDGSYVLTVPDHAKVTPYIVAEGHHTIYLQTFTTRGEDLVNVNFQTPSEPVYQGLVALLKVPVDEHGDPQECAIVSTFNTRNVRDVDFDHFTAYGAHGVAGATAFATPALPKPTYFNENVVPDPEQERSSKDGGVLWTGVPAGVYRIAARHPTRHFASFVATCRPGRIVNANPPWGLYELAPPNPARVRASWSVSGATSELRALTASRVPAGSVVRVGCRGADCALKARTVRPRTRTVDLRGALGPAPVVLRSGQILEVAITTHAFNGLVVGWPAARDRRPRPTRRCVPAGYSRPRACVSSLPRLSVSA